MTTIHTLGLKAIYESAKKECLENPSRCRTRFEKGDDNLVDREYILTPTASYIVYFNGLHENNYHDVLAGKSVDFIRAIEIEDGK